MIFGIGVDVLEARRIDETLERFGSRFIQHLLMPAEQEQLAKTQRPARFLAMRFAAKEAIVKAMGTSAFAHGASGSAMSASSRTPGASPKWCIPSAATRSAAAWEWGRAM